MKSLRLATLLSAGLLMFTSCDEDKKEEKEMMEIGNISLSTDQPKAGETFDLYYDSTDDDIEGTYYAIVKNKSYPMDLDFSKENEQMKSTVKVPDSAQAIAFNIMVDNAYDHNEKAGYVIPLYTAEGKEVAGSKSAIANYKVTYGSQFGIEEELSNSIKAIEDDMAANPEIKDDWSSQYLTMYLRNDKDAARPKVDAYLAEMSKKESLDEDDYSSMMTLYRLTKQSEKMDSIKSIITEKYPNNDFSKSAYVDKFFATKDMAEKEQILNDYTKSYDKMGRMGNYMVSALANDAYKAGNIEQFKMYASKIDSPQEEASMYNNIAWDLAEENKDLDFAAEISKKSLDLLEKAKNDPANRPDYYSPKQYKKNLENSHNMYADTYALILFNQGKIDEAIAIQEKAVGKGKNADMNERYIDYLMAKENYELVAEKSEEFIEEGQGTEKMKEAYKTAYSKKYPDKNDFDDKLASLEKVAYDVYKAEIEKTMLDEEAPDFSIKDAEGNEVSLSSLKGKTVILDFWATWCGPCKASFPGMQEVVTKYKDDDSVKLYFVDTFENGENREQLVTDFIKDNNYDFDVLYDPANDNKYEVAEKYDITGIPTKIVIGPDGKMKFKAVGYSGQTAKLVKEMDIMIDILKSKA